MLGAGDYYEKFEGERTEFESNPYSLSSLVHDEIMTKHPRFPTLVQNIRERRGRKVAIEVPAYMDSLTIEKTIKMDAMAFGMGACCLQATFSCTSLEQARHMYDQLHILSPLMMALSASTPIFNGKLTDMDTRWSVIAQSVDCRRPGESIPKSR